MNLSPPAHVSASLLERLMEVVRPEFRVDVFDPPRDSPVFFQGDCRVPSCPTAVSFAAKGLCNRHYHRWKRHSETNLETWLSDEDALTIAHLTVLSCHIRGCNRAHKGHLLCTRHSEGWDRAGRPAIEEWLAQTFYKPSRRGEGETSCTVEGCERWTDGPTLILCRSHHSSWSTLGRPDLEWWFQELAVGANPRVRLEPLGRQARLEFQFGLQCRYDQANKLTPVRALSSAVSLLARSGVHSMMDLSTEEWRAHLGGDRLRSFNSMARNFLLDVRFCLEVMLVEDDPWADQFPRETWDLRLLGLSSAKVRHLRFAPIVQPWMKELVKRWCRWRLSQGLSPSTVIGNLVACASFSRYLDRVGVTEASGLTRAHIEGWMAASQIEMSASTRISRITSIRTLLNDISRHEWAPGLPPGSLIYPDDQPRKKAAAPRWISEHLMAQMEAPSNIALLRFDQDRVLLHILMQCGLRLGCAGTLSFSCVVHDDSGAPYLAWANRKMQDRPAFFPISEFLAKSIGEQQRRVLERFPDGCRWLFPSPTTNLDGAKPMSGSAFRKRLERWFEQIALADEHGRRARVTSHQFRHTVATRLINANVPQHVVQQLLDHMSPEMTAVYARLHDTTIRRHWERAVKINADGQPVVLGAEHPLNDAAWMRLSMVRAKVTLPNGYCGAPIQTDCEFANPCLDCNFFITTRDFVGQHRQQRDETKQAIAEASHSGLVRLVEKNTRTLVKLDTIIKALDESGPGQVVAGGKVTAADAAS
jgi:site-specific recombinase XerD